MQRRAGHDERLQGWKRRRGTTVVQGPPIHGCCSVTLAMPGCGWPCGSTWLALADSGRTKLQEDRWMDGGLAVRPTGQLRFKHRSRAARRSPMTGIAIFSSSCSTTSGTGGLARGRCWRNADRHRADPRLCDGAAAFLGSVLNINFMIAGTASTNPFLFVLAIVLMLAWKTAGWIGLDRWVLPIVGKPGARGPLRGRGRQPVSSIRHMLPADHLISALSRSGKNLDCSRRRTELA